MKNRASPAFEPLQALGLPSHRSIALLKALHILTPDGRINQDSRRKLKQVQHLLQFATPLLDGLAAKGKAPQVVDFGAGKSYLGFMLWDAWFAQRPPEARGSVTGIEWREELVARGAATAQAFGFGGMRFMAQNTEAALPEAFGDVHVVTALHACDTATDDAIEFALRAQAEHVMLVPCCQAFVAAQIRGFKAQMASQPLSELWRHAHHTREFGSQITNVLRGLRLEAAGYRVSVTELVGWEHSMKNELITASRHPDVPRERAKQRAFALCEQFGLARSPAAMRRLGFDRDR
jgi:hypothetical protein